MAGQAAGLAGQAGHLAAQFARTTRERIAPPRPSAAAWETRLAVRRGIAESMPRLTASLHRLLAESRLGAIRQNKPVADGSADEARQEKSRPRRETPLVPLRQVMRPVSPAQIAPLSVPHQAEMLSDETTIATMPPGGPVFVRPRAAPTTEALPESGLRHLPPAVLREKLVRQSGLGETPAISLRQTLQPHLKFDPAMARLHRGAAAAAAARELDAEAFTIGPDVFFAAGRYAPQTRAGLGLLAHELTHVGQQTALLGDKMRFFTPQGGDALENEAQQTAARVLEAGDHEKTDRTGGALHQTSAPPRPELAFALSPPQSRGAASTPAQKATEESGQPGAKVDPAQADARAVADRVYEIMKQEIALGRERGAVRRKG